MPRFISAHRDTSVMVPGPTGTTVYLQPWTGTDSPDTVVEGEHFAQFTADKGGPLVAHPEDATASSFRDTAPAGAGTEPTGDSGNGESSDGNVGSTEDDDAGDDSDDDDGDDDDEEDEDDEDDEDEDEKPAASKSKKTANRNPRRR